MLRKVAIVLTMVSISITYFLLFPSLSLCLLDKSVLVASSSFITSSEYSVLMEQLNVSLLKEHVVFLSNLGSRVPGYPGADEAASYIYKKFNEYGLKDVYFEEFEITVPVDYGAKIEVLDSSGNVIRTIKAYSLWPNGANPSPTPPEGLVGKIVYGKDGDFKSLNGKEINGSIVLLDFNSWWWWKNVAMLGAKAVIFIEPEETTRFEAEQKFITLPLNFPRLYVKMHEGEYLKTLADRGDIYVRVFSQMRWENVIAKNVIGLLPGQDPIVSNEEIVIAAYYDSWSPVPSVAPGATDATNVAVLLEIARIFSQFPLKRSARFVALSAHWFTLWGAREYADRHFHDLGTRIKLFISLDLATDSTDLSYYATGNLYTFAQQPIEPRYASLIGRINSYVSTLTSLSKKNYVILDGIFKNIPAFEPYPLMFDSDVMTVTCFGGGLAFHTTNSLRLTQKTPIDTWDRLNFNNLLHQSEAILFLTYAFLQDPSLSLFLPWYGASRLGPDWGFAKLTVQVSRYNFTTGWFEPFSHPNALVHVISILTPPTTAMGALGATAAQMRQPAPLINLVVKPDENGKAVIKGLKPFTTGYVYTYVIDEYGRIEYATDKGVYSAGTGGAPTAVSSDIYHIYTENVFKWSPIFRCGSIFLFNILNPYTMQFAPELGGVTSVEVLNFLSHAPLVWWGGLIQLPDVIFFVEPNVPIEIVIRGPERSLLAGFYYPVGFLVNATENSPQGAGYRIGVGETLIVVNTPYKIVKDMLLLSKHRLNILERHGVVNVRVKEFERLSHSLYALAERDLINRTFDSFYGNIMAAWSLAKSFYAALMDLQIDSINVTSFFFFVLVAFSFLLERLILHFEGRKQLLSLAAVMITTLLTFSYLHPGFSAATNTFMFLIGLLVTIVLILPLYFSIREFNAFTKQVREKLLGKHYEKAAEVSILPMLFSLGVENLKRRKIRSSLLLVLIIVITFSLVSFTSISITTFYHKIEKTPPEVAYNGILVRKMPWVALPEQIYLSLKGRYSEEALIAPRAWIYPPRQTLYLMGNVTVQAIVAMLPEESNISEINRLLLKGRWFISPYEHSIILSDRIASEAGLNVGDTIRLWGVNFTVIGIMDGSAFWDGTKGFVDLDEEPLSPINYLAIGAESIMALTVVPHIIGSDIIIIPYDLALRTFNILPMSIAIKFKEETSLLDHAEEVSLSISADTFVGIKDLNKVLVYRSLAGYVTAGFEYMIIPFVLGALIILNSMIGGVYERLREISILSATGSSPKQISLVFLTESAIYAFVGAAPGYLVGLALTFILKTFSLMPPGFYPNYSSNMVILAITLSIAMAISSTIYPSYKASKLVVPSLIRRWKVTEKPHGMEWSIHTPFVATSDEVYGLVEYLMEFFSAHAMERIGIFSAKNMRYGEKIDEKGRRIITLSAEVQLAPFDMGVIQLVEIRFCPLPQGDFYGVEIYTKRLSGFEQVWLASNPRFFDLVRKELLQWRALPTKEKSEYIKRGRALYISTG
ncbi:MAG: FtsX-like permease family protein [Candidatus Bathyarchaeia archaeon]